MIWLWLISFSLAAAHPLAGASLHGRIELRDSKERSVQKGHDYSGVVVWLEPLNAKPPQAAPGTATMVQKNKRFLPHVLAIRTGTVVDFPNQDPIFHNAFSNYSGQIFDIGLYKPGSTRSVAFKRPGIVRVFCNIHQNMSAVIVVLDTPWFATTTASGKFRIDGPPPGEYRLQVFHERATAEELARHTRTVRIVEPTVELPPLQISESGFLPAPHLNKHGKPYESEPESYKVVR